MTTLKEASNARRCFSPSPDLGRASSALSPLLQPDRTAPYSVQEYTALCVVHTGHVMSHPVSASQVAIRSLSQECIRRPTKDGLDARRCGRFHIAPVDGRMAIRRTTSTTTQLLASHRQPRRGPTRNDGNARPANGRGIKASLPPHADPAAITAASAVTAVARRSSSCLGCHEAAEAQAQTRRRAGGQ